MTEKMQETLEALAEKYGTTVSGLVAEMARREIAGNLIMMVSAAMLMAALALAYRHAIKQREDLMYDEDFLIMSFIFSIPGLIIFVVFVTSAIDMTNWILAPRITAIEKIVNMIK